MRPGGERSSAESGARWRFSWSALLWALVYPRRRQRTAPTLAGAVLIVLALGIGSAAYNVGNNILFIALSLLLGCLILSGVLSWLNVRGVDWWLQLAPRWRAGRETVVVLGVRKTKRFPPTYGLWFDLTTRTVESGEPARAESTFSARGIEVRAALARADRAEARQRLFLTSRLEHAGEVRLEWTVRPANRGRLRVSLERVGSLYPFGFLKKQFSADLQAEIVVWPAPVAYRRLALTAAARRTGGEPMARAGEGGDLLALRRYEAGDSHRLIHWKASARADRWLVRQFSAERTETLELWLDTDAAVWPRPEQFELLVSFAATLAEDLFREGRLTGVSLDGAPPVAVRRLHDLEGWLDDVAVASPRTNGPAVPATRGGRRHALLTFAPEGLRGVVALVNGQRIAAA